MSTTYKTIAGDTFESIARKQYGTELEAGRIARGNPGVMEPLASGLVLAIPNLPGAPQDLPQQVAAADPDEVAVLIEGDRFRFWEALRITRAIDTIDRIGFEAPFDVELPGFLEAFRPLSFKPMGITVGGSPLFAGTLVAPGPPTIENDRQTIVASGYSLPGVLNDCMLPASAYPLEFEGQGLQQIAATVAGAFGIGVDFQADPGAVFERVAAAPGKKALAFLIGLAKQRNTIIANNARGELLFWQSVAPGAPVARLTQGSSPVLSVIPTINPQAYYSHITGLEPVIPGFPGNQFTVKNPRLEGVVRPYTFVIEDTLDADVKVSTEAKAGRMFANAVSYAVLVDTWRDPQSKLWAPNTTLTLRAPDALILTEYEFLIRSVEFSADRASRTATLDLVMPGAFSGQIPEALPWDG